MPTDAGRGVSGARPGHRSVGGTDARISEVRPLPDQEATVTVVVPCYNYGHYLPGCVAGVLAQWGVSVDVILVDDASTDDSLLAAKALAAAGSENVPERAVGMPWASMKR